MTEISDHRARALCWASQQKQTPQTLVPFLIFLANSVDAEMAIGLPLEAFEDVERRSRRDLQDLQVAGLIKMERDKLPDGSEYLRVTLLVDQAPAHHVIQ